MLLREMNNRFNTKLIECIPDPYDMIIPNFFIFQLLVAILKSYNSQSDTYNTIIANTPILTTDNLNLIISELKMFNEDIGKIIPTKLLFWFVDRIHELQLLPSYKTYFENVHDGSIEFANNNVLASKVNNLLRRLIVRYDIKFFESSIMTKTVAGCVARFNLIPLHKFTRLTERPFRKANGTSVKVSYMYQNGIFGYYRDSRYTVTSFILSNKDLSFNIISGIPVSNLNDFLKVYMTKQQIRPVSLIMPEIDQYSVLNMDMIFKKMGLTEIFDTFDHKNMFSGDVILSQTICHTQVILKGDHDHAELSYPGAVEVNITSTFQYFVLHIPSNIIILSGIL